MLVFYLFIYLFFFVFDRRKPEGKPRMLSLRLPAFKKKTNKQTNKQTKQNKTKQNKTKRIGHGLTLSCFKQHKPPPRGKRLGQFFVLFLGIMFTMNWKNMMKDIYYSC